MKKMLIIIICIGLAILLICGGIAFYKYKTTPTEALSISNGLPISETEGLFCICETEDEAKDIAEMYGITLVSFDNGVATFNTDRDPNEVISEGVANDYPPIELNVIQYLDSPGDIISD